MFFSVFYLTPDTTSNIISDTLLDLVHEFGAPEKLTFDGAQSQVGRHTSFQALLRKYQIPFHISAPCRPNENPAESKIRIIKVRWYRVMVKKGVPIRLWVFCFILICETGNLCVSSSKYAKGRTPMEIITSEPPDISEYLDFVFYDLYKFSESISANEFQNNVLTEVKGRYVRSSYEDLSSHCTR